MFSILSTIFGEFVNKGQNGNDNIEMNLFRANAHWSYGFCFIIYVAEKTGMLQKSFQAL